MRIQEFPNTEEFYVKDCVIANTNCKLVFPKQIGVKWTEENKIFRSSIWTKSGELVSAGFKKFTNLNEQPEFEPLDKNSEISFIQKLDGSCLIISKFKDELIVRTRGTIDAEFTMANGAEIKELKARYPKLFDNQLLDTKNYSIICEWFSPANLIVEKESDKAELWLICIIDHAYYSYLTQRRIDAFAKTWNIQRPKTFNFNSVVSMVESVKEWKKGEGIVIYGNNDQILKKVKADRYLMLHKIKSTLSSENNFLEFYISKRIDDYLPAYEDFYKIIEEVFDWELAESYRQEITKMSEAGEKVKKIIDNIKEFVKNIQCIEGRKQKAEQIIDAYKQTDRTGITFKLLDNKNLEDKDYKKLMLQVLS